MLVTSLNVSCRRRDCYKVIYEVLWIIYTITVSTQLHRTFLFTA